MGGHAVRRQPGAVEHKPGHLADDELALARHEANDQADLFSRPVRFLIRHPDRVRRPNLDRIVVAGELFGRKDVFPVGLGVEPAASRLVERVYRQRAIHFDRLGSVTAIENDAAGETSQGRAAGWMHDAFRPDRRDVGRLLGLRLPRGPKRFALGEVQRGASARQPQADQGEPLKRLHASTKRFRGHTASTSDTSVLAFPHRPRAGGNGFGNYAAAVVIKPASTDAGSVGSSLDQSPVT